MYYSVLGKILFGAISAIWHYMALFGAIWHYLALESKLTTVLYKNHHSKGGPRLMHMTGSGKNHVMQTCALCGYYVVSVPMKFQNCVRSRNQS